MLPPLSCTALLCAAVFGAAAVGAGDPGVTGYQEAKAASPIQSAAGTGGSTGDSGLQPAVGTLQEDAANGGRPTAGAIFNESDVVSPKISNVKLLAAQADGAQKGAAINSGGELVVIGAEQNGYVHAQGSPASGWAKKTLMMLH